MNCLVCKQPSIHRSPYCARCRPLVVGHADRRRIALRAAYDARLDVFRCWWSGAMLVLDDPTDPFHLCFDRFSPRKDSPLAASSELFRSLRAGLDSIDFPNAIGQLAAHHRGEQFLKGAILFERWRALAPPELGTGGIVTDGATGCVVCGRPAVSRFCPSCRRFVGHRDVRVRARTMREAWSEGGFRCHYTGVVLDTTDPRSPWFLTFDCRVPGERETLVVAAWWVNMMKTALS